MAQGYWGRILRVDLTEAKVVVEEFDDIFYRMYVGGSCLGAYYLLKEMAPGLDAFDPRNVLVFSLSPTTGAPISGASRFNITAKSPLTGAIGDTQGGGYWPNEFKRAGYDALVVTGRADEPCYLWICDDKVEIRQANHIWGKVTGDTQEIIREEVKDPRVRVATIGPAGENLVRFACVITEHKHACGRTGMGAVMGSKNLKAVAVRGHRTLSFADRPAIASLAKWGVNAIPDNGDVKKLKELGTAGSILDMQDGGGLPTRNFRSGVFEGATAISGEELDRLLVSNSETCEGCAVRCKRVVASSQPYAIDSKYGGPEYESVASLGSYVGVDDLRAICKANELCNKYALDTISTGSILAFAMECYESGILSKEDTDGIDLRFGNADAVLGMIDRITFRQGLGDLLAEGSAKAAESLGEKARQFVMAVKGNPLPAHMPRHKASLALIYAVNPFGADHQSHEHDFIITEGATELQRTRARSLGLLGTSDMRALDLDKVRLVAYSQMAYSMLDSLELCQFCYSCWGLYSFEQAVELLRACTGWSASLWELMKLGERRINLLRAFNTREGFGKAQDTLPEREFEPMPEGPCAGSAISHADLGRAIETYYVMMGWDPNTGNPTRVKLEELGLDWVARELINRGLIEP